MGVGINFNPAGVAATAGIQKGKLDVGVTGGTSWDRKWYAGVKANWRF